MKRIAIIGSGISGLGTAWFLNRKHHITLFEAADYIGGHSHTVTVQDEGIPCPIDTGFMVFNHVTYPLLTRLFQTLGVATKPTDMSFSVQHRSRQLEYCGTSLNHLFAQRSNLLKPSFYRMLWQIDRFNSEAKAALEDPLIEHQSLEEYVRQRKYGNDFLELYLIPMSSAVWSTPPEKMRQFPAATLLRFFHNHGFLGLNTQHPWWTVVGGAQAYVEKLSTSFQERIHLNTPVLKLHREPGKGVELSTPKGTFRFDQVILACHPPASLKILGSEATHEERRLLSAFKYQANAVTLHTDEAVLPKTPLARASWNYRIDASGTGQANPAAPLRVSTHYWMNRLQGVSEHRNYFVSVDGRQLLDPEKTLHCFEEEHPLFDREAKQAQHDISALNASAAGHTETYFVGAWQRYGFHEDGLLSAFTLSSQLLGTDPWAAALGTGEKA